MPLHSHYCPTIDSPRLETQPRRSSILGEDDSSSQAMIGFRYVFIPGNCGSRRTGNFSFRTGTVRSDPGHRSASTCSRTLSEASTSTSSS